FTDGKDIGAVLDRNGLRPARYIITKKDLVVMSSEVGVLDISPGEIAVSGRLEPGKMFFIDTSAGRVVGDEEIKKTLASSSPYGKWLGENIVDVEELPSSAAADRKPADLTRMLKCFGYSREDLGVILKPMAEEGKEPVGSMGNDIPHAFLSKRPQLLFDHFKQLFAQVTNPAIDPIREDVVMSMETYIGTGGNILEELPGHCRKLRLTDPVLSDEETSRIKHVNSDVFRAKTVYVFF
nr:glutamate synthase central domain-containing protein [Candidatus Omnitrophota bacterium]